MKTKRINYLTQEGFNKLKKEYDSYIHDRPQALANLKNARELGDLSENGYYKASRAKLSFIDSKIVHLKNILKNVHIVTAGTSKIVAIGSIVTVKNINLESKYRIVSRYETDPSQGLISDLSPLGKGLINKKVGDKVLIKTPSGVLNFTIVKIES